MNKKESLPKGLQRVTCNLFSIVLIFLPLFFSPLFPSLSLAETEHNILILHSYHKGYPWTANVTEGILSVLEKEEHKDNLFIEYMDSKRNPPEKISPLLKDLFTAKYRNVPLDVIIASDNNALGFLIENRTALFGEVPVVFCGINNYNKEKLFGHKKYTGVVEYIEIEKIIEVAIKLHPSLEEMAVITDITPTGKANLEIFQKIAPSFEDRIRFRIFSSLSAPELAGQLQNLPEHSAVLNLSFFRDPEGRVFSTKESLEFINQFNKPMYVPWAFFVGPGGIGGRVVSGFQQGKISAEMAREVLHGKDPDMMPVIEKSPNVYLFDYMQMMRFNISPSELPKDSRIINEPQSFYWQYKKYIWAVAGVFVFLLVIILILTLNIFRRKQAERALDRQLHFLQVLLDTIPSPIFYKDVFGRYMGCNRAFEKFLGHSRKHIMGKTVYDLAPAKLAPLYDQKDQLLFQNPGLQTYEEEVETAQGRRNVIFNKATFDDEKGELAGLVGVIIDITSRKQAELQIKEYQDHLEHLVEQRTAELSRTNAQLRQQIAEREKAQESLRESEAISRILLNAPPDTSMLLDPDGTILAINKVGAERLSTTVREAVGKNAFSLLSSDLSAKRKRQCQAVIDSGRLNKFEEKHQGRYFDYGIYPVFDAEGNVIRLAFYSRDITDRKKLEEEILQSRKLESVGELAGGIAHDFNNLLTAILGGINLATVQMDKNHPAAKTLEQAIQASFKARDLTQRFITFSTGGEPVKTIQSTADILRDAAELALSGSNIKPVFNVEANIWPVEVDRGQMGQALYNVVENAKEAMPGGGVLHIKAANLEHDAEKSDMFPPLETGKYVKICIQDQGRGIPDRHLSKIFDPYFTTKERGEDRGKGLGLTVTYSVIKKHGGDIDISSRKNKGTTVCLYIPASLKPLKKEKEIQRGKRLWQETFRTARILIMDDERLLTELVTEMLSHLGYEAKACESGQKAIELYQQSISGDEPFDLLILDLTVPGGMGGKETLLELKKIDPNVKAIVSSGYSSDPVMHDFASHGFAAALTKPYNMQQLSDIIAEVLADQVED